MRKRIYNCNDDYFETIDTEEKSYFLGLLMADGCNSDNRLIALFLQEGDREIIDKFKKFTNYEGKVEIKEKKKSNWSNSCGVRIMSRKLATDLARHGIVPRKSHIADLPTTIPDDLMHHFIRGLFDGDGCVRIDKRGFPSFSIIGNRPLIDKIQQILMKKCNLKKTKLHVNTNSPDNIIHVIYSRITDCIRIREYLYKDATIFLQRKYDKFISVNKHECTKCKECGNNCGYNRKTGCKRDICYACLLKIRKFGT